MTRSLNRLLASAGVLVGLLPSAVRAQATTVSGRVASETNAPLQGASVSIPALGVGAYTQADGRYSFTVPAARTGAAVTITARRIGFQQRTATVTFSGAAVTQDFTLAAAPTQLEAVVTTALGLERQKSTLGTAQQQVSSTELNQTRALNVVEQLQGKVSGVQITSPGTQGGSVNIVIRGQNSITGSNQPLFVVDGVPISNANRGGDPSGAFDYGSAISDLNPSDIESMSVLKGPNAAALYGSRAANGVIVITTKRARNTQGRIRTEINSNYTFDRPGRLWDYQNLYGQGAGGEFLYVDGAGGGVHDDLDQSFGPKLDGRTTGCTFKERTTTYDTSVPCKQFDAPNGGPWIPQPNNVRDFFQTGHTGSLTVAVSGGTERASARLSMGSDNVEGYIPNNFFQKTSGILSGNLQVNDRLSTNGTVQYIRNSARNRPGTGYNAGILEQFVWFGRQVNMNSLKNYKRTGAANGGPSDREYNWNYNFHNNPFWLQNENPLTDARDRLIGTASASFRILDWLNATARTSSDIYRYNIDRRFQGQNLTWADPAYAGGFTFTQDYRNENNADLLFTANRGLGSWLTLNATAGGNLRYEQATTNQQRTNGISVAGIYNVSNAAITPTLFQDLTRRKVNSAYGSAAFTFSNWWTIEGTARNDWSSTLPKGANSYFYPSVNTSVVLTDAIPALRGGSMLSYLKVRGSVARVGNDAPPYQLATVYEGNPNKFGGLPQFSLSNAIANPTLRPEITRSSEAGVELGLLDGRVTLDASYYLKSTRDQIFNIAISPTTGFSSKAINAGRIDNRGVEALLTLVPLRTSGGLEWSTTFNYTTNKSRVVQLSPGIDRIVLGSTWNTNAEARVGQPYGTIYGYDFLRDSASGQRIISGGLTQRGPLKVLGNIQPKWIGSWSNSFTYKRVSLNVLLDAHRGGQFFSVSNWWGDYAGITKASLAGRELDWDNPGYIAKGLDRSKCGAGSHVATGTQAGNYVCVNKVENATTVTSEDYFQAIYPVVSSSIYTANWVKLRELRVGVDLPERWSARMHSQSVNLAFTGRNLWLSTAVPNIDPEFAYSSGNAGTFAEFAALPNARSLGISLRVTP